jgi:hypothetical protein
MSLTYVLSWRPEDETGEIIIYEIGGEKPRCKISWLPNHKARTRIAQATTPLVEVRGFCGEKRGI